MSNIGAGILIGKYSITEKGKIQNEAVREYKKMLKEKIKNKYKENEKEYGKEHSGAELMNNGLEWLLKILN